MEILVLVSSVFIGILLSRFIIKSKKKSKLLLTFSGAYFLAMTILEILPHVYANVNIYSHKRIGLLILSGVLVQYILETISKGVEHGHIHMTKKGSFPLGMFMGLFLHSIIEAIPIANAQHQHFMWAIFVHNIPISMILYNSLSHNTDSSIKKIMYIVLFALSSPLGFILGKYTYMANYTLELSALVSGIFLHISTVILFESTDDHRFSLKKFISIIVGFTLAYLTISIH